MILEYAYKNAGDLYKKLLEGIPKGKYFDNRAEIIPAQEVSEFRVHTDYPNEIHYISVVCENGMNINTTTIPSNKDFVLRFNLPNGLNTITIAYNEKEITSKSYSNTYFGTILYAYADNFKDATVRMDRLVRDIYQQESTRISSPVQHYAKDLPDKKALRIFGLQLITRALINSPGTFESLEDICKAIYISTPLIEDVEYKNIFDLSHYSFAGQEYELGKIIYLWVRSPSLVRKLYGLILAHNFGIPTDVTDSTLENEEGFNEYDISNLINGSDESTDADGDGIPDDYMSDIDNPLVVDDNGYTEYDTDEGDGYLEIKMTLNMELPRLDRNLPIPFTSKHPWHDRDTWKPWEHLDTPRPLDISTWFDPMNKGLLMKQEISYRYDGSKVTSLIKVTKLSHTTNGFITLSVYRQPDQLYISVPEVASNATGDQVPVDNADAGIELVKGGIMPEYYDEATSGIQLLGGTLEV